MGYIVYLRNGETGAKAIVDETRCPVGERQKNRIKRYYQKALEREGLDHMSVHEKKI